MGIHVEGVNNSTAAMADADYAFSRIPITERKSGLSLTLVWTGYILSVTGMLIGGGMAERMAFTQVVMASLVGNVFLGVIAMAVSYIAARQGLTFSLLARYSFGLKGSRIASFFVPIVNLGWYVVKSAIFGHFLALIFKLDATGEAICMVVSTVLMGILALRGLMAIAILDYLATPAIVFLSLFAVKRAMDVAGGFANILAYTPQEPLSFGSGVTIVIGSWILASCTSIADIMRYAKTPGAAMGSAFFGLLFGNTLMIVCGAAAAIAVGNSDLPAVLLSMGLLVPSLVLMTTNVVTTNVANLYSNSLNLANCFRVNRRVMIGIILVVAAATSLLKPYRVGALFIILDSLGSIIPPLGGIIIADAFLVRRFLFPDLVLHRFRDWNYTAFVTWLVSLVTSFMIPSGFPALVSFMISIILYPLCNRFIRKDTVGVTEKRADGTVLRS